MRFRALRDHRCSARSADKTRDLRFMVRTYANAPPQRVHRASKLAHKALRKTARNAAKPDRHKNAPHPHFFGKPDTANNGHEAPRRRCLCNGSKNTDGGGRATTSTNVLKGSGTQTVATPLMVAAAWPPPPAPHKNHPTLALLAKHTARPDRSPR